MTFNLTMERTLRVSTEIEASNELEAICIAERKFKYAQHHPEEFEGGWEDCDYAMTDANGKDVIPWNCR